MRSVRLVLPCSLALLAGCPVATTPPDDAGALDAAVTDANDHDAAVVADAWSAPDTSEPCTTPGTIEHLPCGHCGTLDRFCTSANVWTYGVCTGETGVCNPGDTQVGPCGRCGQQAQFCTELVCAWTPMGACLNETGACVPGTTTRVATGCPSGQTRIESCSDDCTITEGPCAMLECDPGMTTSEPCGRCGIRQRSCDATGHWVDGMCLGEGECDPGATGSVTCEVCGTQASTCDATCHWMATGACVGGVTCPPRPLPSCLDANTMQSYDGPPSCVAAACVYSPTTVSCLAGCMSGGCVGGAMLVSGLGGTAGFGEGVLAPSDDDSSMAIDLTSLDAMGLSYYGTRHTTLFVNNNGNVTFDAPQMAYSPMLPGATSPMIAPFWGDVDTRGGGSPARNNVNWDLTSRLVVTWDHVGTFMTNDTMPNSFQLILTPRADRAPGDFDVEMRYALCQWTMGMVSPSPATAGFDAGDHTRFLALPGSGTPSILNLCTTSNVGSVGIWRYEVRAGIPVAP